MVSYGYRGDLMYMKEVDGDNEYELRPVVLYMF